MGRLTQATQRSNLKSSLTFLLLFIKIVINYTENKKLPLDQDMLGKTNEIRDSKERSSNSQL